MSFCMKEQASELNVTRQKLPSLEIFMGRLLFKTRSQLCCRLVGIWNLLIHRNEAEKGKQGHHIQCFLVEIVGHKGDLNRCHRSPKSRALNHSANFHHWSQTTALFWIGVLSSQGGTLYLLNTWLPFGVVPPCCAVITVTVTFFVFPHWRKKTESLFFCPYLLIIFPSAPTWWLRVRGVNSVHFNYDLFFWDKGGGALWGWDAGGARFQLACLLVWLFARTYGFG